MKAIVINEANTKVFWYDYIMDKDKLNCKFTKMISQDKDDNDQYNNIVTNYILQNELNIMNSNLLLYHWYSQKNVVTNKISIHSIILDILSSLSFKLVK